MPVARANYRSDRGTREWWTVESVAQPQALRYLAHEGLSIFATRQHTPVQSAQYRAVLEETLDRLDDDGKREAADLLHLALVIWHACEIMFLLPEQTVTGDLVAWVTEHFADEMERQRESDWEAEIERAEVPDESNHYWNLVHRYVSSGRIDDARRLLAVPYPELDDLLVSADALPFQAWQQACEKLLLRYTNDENIRTLLRILTGDEDTIAFFCGEAWQKLLVAELLFRNPPLDKTTVGILATECARRATHPPNDMQRILLSVLEGDVAHAIRAVAELGYPWVPAHLADLLAANGMLDVSLDTFECDVREYWTVEYAQSLAEQPWGWQLAAVYLETCPSHGRACAEAILSRVYPSTEREARKLVGLCKRLDLPEVARSVSVARGVKWAKARKPGAAVPWLLNNASNETVQAVADSVVSQCLGQGSLTELNAVASAVSDLGSSSSVPTALHFLACYRDTLLVMQDRQVVATDENLQANIKFLDRQAAARIVAMLERNQAPRRFWGDLLLLAMPLLRAATVPFTVDQTALLLRRLQELQLSHRRGDLMARLTEDEIERLQLVLAEAHARAIVSPPA